MQQMPVARAGEAPTKETNENGLRLELAATARIRAAFQACRAATEWHLDILNTLEITVFGGARLLSSLLHGIGCCAPTVVFSVLREIV